MRSICTHFSQICLRYPQVVFGANIGHGSMMCMPDIPNILDGFKTKMTNSVGPWPMVPDFWHRPIFDPLHAKKMATWFCKKNEMFRSQACWPCTPDPPWPMTLIQDVKRFHIFLRCSIEHASHAQMNLNLIGNWGPWHVFSLLSEGKQQWWGDQRWFTTKGVSKLNHWVQQRCLGRFLRSWRRQHESWKTGMESPGFCGWDMDVLVWINGRGPLSP